MKIYTTLQVSEDNEITTISLNRPKSLNALNRHLVDEIGHFFSQDLSSLKGIVITGSGDKAFAAGADITEFNNMTAKEGSDMSQAGKNIFNLIENCPIPVIAAVNGYALGGGCELALSCHLIIAGENAKFGQPEVNLGLIPGYDGIKRLIQRIGKSRATEYLLTADMISATQAVEWGLASYKVKQGHEIEKAKEIINKISMKGSKAVSSILQCVNLYFDGQQIVSELESKLFGELITSDQAKEGINAFLEKRKPTF